MAKKRFVKFYIQRLADKANGEMQLRYSVGSGRLHKDGLAGLFMSDAQIEEANRHYDEVIRKLSAPWSFD